MILGMPKRTLIIAAALLGVALLGTTGGVERLMGGFSESCRFTVSADALNVRSAPHEKAPVMEQVAKGDEVDAKPVVKNGYRMLEANRWVSDEFLTSAAGSVCT